MKKVVLDTNILLVSISSKSKLHWVFKHLLNNKFSLCVTTDILAEYAEIIEQKINQQTSEHILGVLKNLQNVHFINTYFRFNLLNDEDDNKFVDCAIASNAKYIVSHDKDFDVLATIDFPKIKVIDTKTFKLDF